MIRPSWIELLVSSRMRVVAPLAAVAGAAGLHRAAAQGTPTAIDADARLDAAMATMARLRSYRFELQVESGQIEIIPEVFAIQRLDGEVVRPDSFRADADLELLVIDVDLEVVTIGDTTWITNPLVLAGSDDELVRVGDLDLGMGFNPASVINPDRIALPLLGVIEEATETGEEPVNGIETFRIEGVITSEGLESLGESFGDASIAATLVDPMLSLPATVWIDGESLVRRLEVRGQIFERENSQIRRVFTFRDFDAPFEIERPA